MILKTKEAVTYNKPMSGTETNVLIGTIQSRQRQGKNYFGANYLYALENGTIVSRSAFELRSEAEIIGLNDMIKDDLPVYEETPEPEFEEMKVFLAFRLEMFKMLTELNPTLTLEDIEILPIEVSFEPQEQ